MYKYIFITKTKRNKNIVGVYMKGVCSKIFGIGVLMVMILITLIGSKVVFASANGVTISAFDEFSSTSYIMMEANTGKVLVNFNERERLPVASICKLMTTLITLEAIDDGRISMDTMLVASKNAASVEGSQAFLDAGSEYSVADLLKSVIIASANDSAIVLAEGISGSEDTFADMMNDRASQLGMKDTHYTNATGLTTKEQYSTAYDTCLILREVNKHSQYGEYARIWMDELVHPSGRVTELVNTNRLLKYYPYCIDGKTGYTDEAGYCLSSISEKGGLKLIAVALNCNNAGARFYESMKLYDYGFANYSIDTVISAQNYIDNVATNRADVPYASVGISNDIVYLHDKTSDEEYKLVYNIPDTINAGAKAGDVIGNISLYIGEELVSSSDVVLLNDVNGHRIRNVFDKIFDKWAM